MAGTRTLIPFLCLLIGSTALQSPLPQLSARTHLNPLRTSTTIMMARGRGLEKRVESATPQEGGMTLYLKAGPEGPSSVGDCPFAHWVRLVLEEKNLEYQVQPAVEETKPQWLIDHYGGKMPALRHQKECYVESSVICDYLDYFFPEPPLKSSNKGLLGEAEAVTEGFFPALAQYLKHTPDGDDDDKQLEAALQDKLSKLDEHLSNHGPYLVGSQLTLLDLSLAPKLYHMVVGLEAFKKEGAINVQQQYPNLHSYMDGIFARESFQKTVYPRETVIWGWSNARQK